MANEAPSRLLAALKKRFKTPRDALRALGLDEQLRDLPRDGKRRLGRDQEDPDVNAALRDFVSKLDPDQMAVLFQMLEEQMAGMAPPDDDDELTEDDPDFPGAPKVGGGRVPLGAQDSSFYKMFPGAARIGNLGGNPQKERAYITKAQDKRRPRLAQDARQAMRRAPSGYAMFPNAKRIGFLG